MSKTYYKYPSVKDYSRNHTKWAKRQASKAVRRDWNINDGGDYKRTYCSWDIIDYKCTYYYDFEVIDSWYSEKGQMHKIPKKNLQKHFRRESIRYMMDSHDSES